MNKEEIVRTRQGKKTYQAPQLNVYGRVSQLTSSGSGTFLEGQTIEFSNDDEKQAFVDVPVDFRP